MGTLKIEGVTHWSIGVNDLAESETFYGDLLGLAAMGRLGNPATATMSCFNVGDHNILLCEQGEPRAKAPEGEDRVHHSFTVTPETLVQACKVFREENVEISQLVYRKKGYFTGRELYFYDPSGNRLELRDPTWVDGMPEPSFDELAES